jgi:hypothetical protein
MGKKVDVKKRGALFSPKKFIALAQNFAQLKSKRRVIMATLSGILLGAVGLVLAPQNEKVNTNCAEIEAGLQAAYKGESFEGKHVVTHQRVVTLLDHESDPNIPDFECSAPVHISASAVKLQGKGDVLIKLADHANAPLLIVGPIKSYPGDEYLALPQEVKDAFRVKQVHVDNIRLDGNRLKQDHECWTHPTCDNWEHPLSSIRSNGITVRYSEFVTLTNIKVKSTISGGFVAERHSNNLLVDGYESDDNHFDGFTAYQTTNSVFKNLSLNDNLAAGISLDLDVINNTFINVIIKDAGDVGLFARATHKNYFKNMLIENPGSHGIFLARHGDMPADVEGVTPWDTATANVFEDLTVVGSKRGVGIRINDKVCVKNRLTRYEFLDNAYGDISLAQEGMLIVDPQEPQGGFIREEAAKLMEMTEN